MSPEAERTIRKRRIDPRLTRAGWKVGRFQPGLSASDHTEAAVEEYETSNGPADYALCDGGRVQGVVEAKKVTLGPQGVLTQAERYSKGFTRYRCTKASSAWRSCTRPTARWFGSTMSATN
jgi:type I restriction enzyme, R subunit